MQFPFVYNILQAQAFQILQQQIRIKKFLSRLCRKHAAGAFARAGHSD
jgi:hypothetical protein